MFALNFDIILYPHSSVVHVEKYNYLFLQLRFGLPMINILKFNFNFLEIFFKKFKLPQFYVCF
jgi:hypothetical protein